MTAWGRLGRWLPVVFVCGLISWCYVVFLLDILVPLLDSPDQTQHDYGLGCTIAFNVIFALAIISFIRAVCCTTISATAALALATAPSSPPRA